MTIPVWGIYIDKHTRVVYKDGVPMDPEIQQQYAEEIERTCGAASSDIALEDAEK